jgi:hypothetical protein
MKDITFVGVSGGGQFVQRYSTISPLIESMYRNRKGSFKYPHLQFILSNPSSYAYLSNKRYSYNCGTCQCDEDACACDSICTQPDLKIKRVQKKSNDWPCWDSEYNNWPYGIPTDVKSAVVPYVMKAIDIFDPTVLYHKRNVVVLVGQNDTWYVTIHFLCFLKHNYCF